MADKDQKFYTSGDSSCTSGGVVPIVFSKTCLTCADGEAPIDIEAITWQGDTYTLTFFLTDKTKRILPIPHTHALSELSDVDVSGVSTGQVLQKSAGDWTPLTLAAVATSGSYNDLSDTPTYALNDLTDVSVAGVTTGQVLQKSSGDWTPLTLASVATSGSYNDLLNKPFATSPTDQALVYYDNGTSLYTTIGRPGTFEGKVITYNSSGDLEWVDIEFLAAGVTGSVQYKGPTGILAGNSSYVYNGTNAELSGGYFQAGNLRLEDSTFQNLSGRLTITSAVDIKISNLTTGSEQLVKVDASGVLGTTLATAFINGTADYIPKFSSTSSIVNSTAFFSGNNLTLGHSGTTTLTGLAGGAANRLVSTDVNGTLVYDAAGTAGTIPVWESVDNIGNSKLYQSGSDVLANLNPGGGFIAQNSASGTVFIQAAVNYGGGSQNSMTLTTTSGAGALQFTSSATAYGQMYMTTTEIGFYEGSAISGNRIMQMDLSANTIIFNRNLFITNSPPAGSTSNQVLTRDTSSGALEYLNFSAFSPASGTYVEIGGSTLARILVKILPLGGWNMDTTPSIAVAHGISSGRSYIRWVGLVIIPDDDIPVLPWGMVLDSGATALSTDVGIDGNTPWTDTHVNVTRVTGGAYDGTNYDGEGNRGYLTIIYEDLAL